MNKTELVKKVAAENELNQKQAAAVVDSVLNAVVDTVAAGEAVALFGFGTFSLKHRDARQGRNPATGEAMVQDRSSCIQLLLFIIEINTDTFSNRGCITWQPDFLPIRSC